MTRRELLDLVELCYASILDRGCFHTLTRRICEIFGADAGDIVAEFPRERRTVTFGSHGFDPVFLETYDEDFLGSNPWFANLSRYPRDRFHTDEIEPPDFWRGSYYNDWVRPQGFRHTIGAVVDAGPDHHVWAGFTRAASRGTFDDAVEDLTALLPHLRRGIEMRSRWDRQCARTSQLSQVIDALATPVLLLDAKGIVHRMNSAAERFLSSCRFLRIGPTGRLMAAGGRADARLGSAVFRAANASDRPGDPPPEPIVLECAESQVALHIVRLPAECRGTSPSATVLATVSSLADIDDVDVSWLVKAYGLTATEARLAAWIGSGRSVRAFAEARGISVGTARWHLKNIEAKTGTGRIGELVAKIAAAQAPIGVSLPHGRR
jgi:DNA-binding CsgD family transcriptional regulator